jgi:hypothetical protein
MSKHRIKIDGPGVKGVKVNACLLRTILDLVIEGSQRAVRIRTQGRSTARGLAPKWIEASSEFSVQILEGSTLLEIEAPSLMEADPDEFAQRDLFPDIDPERTSIDYFTDSLSAALEGENQANLYDKSFLEFLHHFDSILNRGVNTVKIISDGNGIRTKPVTVTRAAIPIFKSLVKKIPDPQQVRIAGKLDQIRHSDYTLRVLIPEPAMTVKGVATANQLQDLKQLWGKLVLVSGVAHFNAAKGIQRIEVDHLEEASEKDLTLWGNIPEPLFKPLVKAELRKSQGSRSGLNAILGKWPGDESEEDILMELERLS